ncbi:hypothetical protein FEMY_20230 [Ferrovum myxofaciens]|uniref:PLD phosphodiesterase domain-containing protein n=1 Tax=Ferrovum myxofaciens TaxID=416213 RepID=A0A149VW67_9PROT|nr:phospholipase D-like domain-containing protein [Ferrovum myxofaciens]KXW57460.1 hypothetical protein FEMY_20230 [Ferrovum myxofaciens]
MKLYSTLLAKEYPSEWKNELTSACLFPENGAVRDVTIISAYTDLEMLGIICNQSFKQSDKRTGVRIRIFLDRLASTYENDKVTKMCMDSLGEKLQRNGASGSGIWLVKIGSLFHAKAVVIETNTNIACMVGSLNMTKKAFARNEELVLLGQSEANNRESATRIAKRISGEYCESLQAKSKQVPFSKEKIDQDSLQSLMLSGLMFHEVKEADPFRFNIGLPERFLEIKQTIHPLMKAELKDSISLETIITGSNSNDGLGYILPKIGEDGSRESWKKYCLDTCYGFWCPDLLRDDAEQAINSKRESRKPKFEGENGKDGLFSVIKTRRKEITNCLHKILSSLNDKIIGNDISDPNWVVENVFSRWDSWYERLESKLKNEEICNRIILGVSPAPVPNVWSDPITSGEFESSFVDSLQFAFAKGEVTRFRKVITTLKETYKLDPQIMRGGNETEILQHLEERINQSSKIYDIEDLGDAD